MRKTKFSKGDIPHNKGKKLEEYLPAEKIEKIRETQFKAGEEHVGDTHPSWTGGVQHMTADCAYLWAPNGIRHRRPRLVYEKNYGPIPAGYIILHIDGDKDNDAPENLKAISRAELVRLNAEKKKLNN